MNHPAARKYQKGQGMSEYLIIVALIAVSTIAVFAFFGDVLQEQMGGLAQEMSGQSGDTQIQAAQQEANQAAQEASTETSLGSYDRQRNN